ncbi:hypothetical protein [Erwinia sp. MYb375]
MNNTHGTLGGLDRGGLMGGTVRSSDDQRIVANHINNRQGLFSAAPGWN